MCLYGALKSRSSDRIAYQVAVHFDGSQAQSARGFCAEHLPPGNDTIRHLRCLFTQQAFLRANFESPTVFSLPCSEKRHERILPLRGFVCDFRDLQFAHTTALIGLHTGVARIHEVEGSVPACCPSPLVLAHRVEDNALRLEIMTKPAKAATIYPLQCKMFYELLRKDGNRR